MKIGNRVVGNDTGECGTIVDMKDNKIKVYLDDYGGAWWYLKCEFSLLEGHLLLRRRIMTKEKQQLKKCKTCLQRYNPGYGHCYMFEKVVINCKKYKYDENAENANY